MKSCSYVSSALEAKEWPRLLTPSGAPLPEIALAGRSNVGKSTFINLLSGQKRMAKISSTPGKTQRLQFFLAEDTSQFVLVDLPGYGFASASKLLQEEWSRAIDLYLNERASLRAVYLLLDIRRDLSPDDLVMIEWAKKKNMPLRVFFTKTDLLSNTERMLRESKAKEAMASYGIQHYVFLPTPKRILSCVLHETLR